MEALRGDDLTEKLILILKKTIESKNLNSIYTEKFLATISNEFPDICENIIHVPEFSNWLSGTFQKWKETNPNFEEVIFICKFIRILTKSEQGFKFLLNINALTELMHLLLSDAFEQTSVRQAYISFLSDILTHNTGFQWVKNTEQWKTVSKLYFFNSNLYIEREGLNFLETFITKVVLDDKGSNEILQEIFLFFNTCNENNLADQKFCSVVLLHLKLVQSLLETNMFSKNSFFLNKLIEILDLQSILQFLLSNSKQEIILEKASIIQIVIFVFQYEDKKELLHSQEIPAVFDYFFALLKKSQFNSIIRLAKYCQVLLSEMRRKLKSESETGLNYIIVQLMPALMCTKSDPNSYNVYVHKLFSFITSEAQNFCNLLYDEIRCKVGSKPTNLAVNGILSVISNTESFNSKEAVIIFQAMTYLLKSFILDNSCSSESANLTESEKETFLGIQDTAILSSVLNALCILIERFKIKWSESSESLLCLLNMTCAFLENPNLSPIVVVKVFSLVKLAILNFTSSDLSFLSNNMKDFNFSLLMSLLYKRLHDPNWEIRDSCLEVVTVIAELSESKYPAFEHLLLEKNFCSLVFNIMEGDSESYVRASSIQALTSMLKVEALNKLLISMNISKKIIQLLQNESEAIVRREAALMIKQLYLATGDSHDELITSFYKIMSFSAICDLHWEVKVNSLDFWEAVIKRLITNESMINNFIPEVTPSKEENEVKAKLDKVIKKLSETGCFHVLFATLNEDCDMPVIRKSAQILSELMKTLNNYGINKYFEDISVDSRLSVKRKHTVLELNEKRKIYVSVDRSGCHNLDEINSESFINEKFATSDVIIDEIVNEKDINLLGGCFQKDQSKSSEKKLLLQELKPEIFLFQMQNFNFEEFLEKKQKWLMNLEVDFKSLLFETCTVNVTDETNVMDCY